MKQSFRLIPCALGALMVVACTVGCAHHGAKQNDKAPNENAKPRGDADSVIVGNPPADSKFAKLSIGMSMGQVTDLIGQPTDTRSYTTGKAFIPFYYGRDMARTEARYKGEGRITFTGVGMGGANLKVYRIEYDPKEPGYNK